MPPIDPKTGEYKPDTSVSDRVTGLMQKNNPLMRQARTRGAQYANRRGLLNSSMGAQAGEAAALEQVVPIASQEAQQGHQTRIARMNVGAEDRKQAASLAASFENSYSSMISNIMNNPEIGSSAREKYIRHAGAVRDSNLSLVEQMYGIKLEWGTPQGAGSGGATQQSFDRMEQQSSQIQSLQEEIKRLSPRLPNR